VLLTLSFSGLQSRVAYSRCIVWLVLVAWMHGFLETTGQKLLVVCLVNVSGQLGAFYAALEHIF